MLKQLALSASLLLAAQAQACMKADVEYYLQQGFSHEQVVQLCTSASTAQSSVQAKQSDSAAEELRRTIAAEQVVVEGDQLSFTAKACVKYGATDAAGFRTEICPLIRFTVALKGSEIETDQNYDILGFLPGKLVLKGDFTHEVLNARDYSAKELQIIEADLHGRPLHLPIRAGYSSRDVADNIRALQRS